MYVNFTLFWVTTIGTILGSLSQLIVTLILTSVFQENDHARKVRDDIAEVRTEMSQISIMDEFARHARLQRKLIKLQDELKAEKMSVNSTRLKYKVMVGSAVSVSRGIIALMVLYLYRSEPVLVLPEQWLSPLSSIVSWPSEETGAVSVLFWITVCGFVSRSLANKLS